MAAARPATTDDLTALVELQSQLFTEDAGEHDPHADTSWPSREGRADFERLLQAEDAAVFVVESDGDLVAFLDGYAAASSPTRQPVTFAVLRSLFVRVDARRTGAATLLVDRFVDWASRRECVEVHVDHYAANEAAAGFYASLGFAPRSVSNVRPL